VGVGVVCGGFNGYELKYLDALDGIGIQGCQDFCCVRHRRRPNFM